MVQLLDSTVAAFQDTVIMKSLKKCQRKMVIFLLLMINRFEVIRVKTHRLQLGSVILDLK